MIVKPFTKPQLQSLQEGLRRDLNAVLAANASSKKKLDQLSTPENLQKFKPDALAVMRREAIEEESRAVLDIIRSLADRKKIIKQQQGYWDKDFWRDALLYSGAPEVRLSNDAVLLSSEKAIQSLASYTAFASATLLENSGKAWLTREMELMNTEGFIKAVGDASESGAAAVLYLARLVFDTKTFRSDEERSKASSALFTAEQELQLPVRSEALDTLTACSELAEDIESAWKALSTGGEDIRSRVRPYTAERKAREAAEKAAEEESKLRLEAVEDSLLLQGHI